MSLKEISNGYFNLFVKNPKNLDLFLMHRKLQNLTQSVEKIEEAEKQQTEDLSL